MRGTASGRIAPRSTPRRPAAVKRLLQNVPGHVTQAGERAETAFHGRTSHRSEIVKLLSFAIAAMVVVAGCSSRSNNATKDSSGGAAAATAGGSDAQLTGAGATFPAPIYQKWFADYAAKTGVKINYQPIGSGGGIRQLSEQTVDFGASDAPMSEEEMGKAKGRSGE